MKRHYTLVLFALALLTSVLLFAGAPLSSAADPTPAAQSIPKPGAKPDKIAMPAKVPPNWLTYHLAHPGPGGTYPADPDCAIFWKGQYHLHYIFQRGPHNHCYAHVTSPDMVHWKWQPTPLTTDNTGHGMFSGGVFLTKEGPPGIIYHGLGSGFNQISVALDDKLEKWTKPTPMVGLTKDGKKSAVKYWDPDCWLEGDTYYAISGGKGAFLFKSTDLKKWEEVGPLLHDDMPGNLGVSKNEDISCPNMFKIGDKWMLLCISHGMACRYYLGTFKDERFLPDFHGRMNWRGQEFFAPESLQTPDGRRVMWAWLQLKGAKFQGGVQSLPRELSLPADGVLHIKPLKELESLRDERKTVEGVTVKAGANSPLSGIEGDALELAVKFKPSTAKTYGLRVLCDAEGKGGLAVRYEAGAKLLLLDDLKVPFELKPGEELNLRVFVDKTLVEVFANDRQAAVAVCRTPTGTSVSLLSEGGDAEAHGIEGWRMKSAY
ncbi:MAG: glycoside hydrolase family 32 protein [Planctomycetes bacterium]|nr:glycoside hydrolase family 32 protein [Planctomycetota bacterium]